MKYLRADIAELLSDHNNKEFDAILNSTYDQRILSNLIDEITTEICIAALTGHYSVKVCKLKSKKLPDDVIYAIDTWFKKLGYKITYESVDMAFDYAYYCYYWNIDWNFCDKE